jgi:hypothetical protein
MSQSYLKECIFCKQKIRMSDQKEGKWLPYPTTRTELNMTARKMDQNKTIIVITMVTMTQVLKYF